MGYHVSSWLHAFFLGQVLYRAFTQKKEGRDAGAASLPRLITLAY